MAMRPYTPFVQRYFPIAEWERAECVIEQECPSSSPGWPYSCVREEGLMSCGTDPTPRQAHAYGMFGLLDVCYDPAANPGSPFTPYQWMNVLDPNVNAWMASIIWSYAGWRAWTTCPGCNACDVLGEPVPYPRGPVDLAEPSPPLLWLLLPVVGAIIYSLVAGRGQRERKW